MECLCADMALVINRAPTEGTWEQAARLCQNLMCLPHAPVELWYWLAVARRFQGLLEQAEAATVEFLRREPGCSCAWWIYGKIEQDRKNFDKAIAHFVRAIALEPDTPGLWNEISKVYEEAGHLEPALASLRWACALRSKTTPSSRDRIARLTEAIARRGDSKL